MKLSDRYAQKHGYLDASNMLTKLKVAAMRGTLASSIEWSVQHAVVTALRTIDASNDSTEGKSE